MGTIEYKPVRFSDDPNDDGNWILIAILLSVIAWALIILLV